MDEELFTLLTGSAAVMARATGVYWGVAPQDAALPYVVLNVISGTDRPLYAGTDGFWEYRVQVDCYGPERPTARLLSRDVIALLNGYRGGSFRGVFIDAQREDFEDAAVGRPSSLLAIGARIFV